jgi:hypothetical protein
LGVDGGGSGRERGEKAQGDKKGRTGLHPHLIVLSERGATTHPILAASPRTVKETQAIHIPRWIGLAFESAGGSQGKSFFS